MQYKIFKNLPSQNKWALITFLLVLILIILGCSVSLDMYPTNTPYPTYTPFPSPGADSQPAPPTEAPPPPADSPTEEPPVIVVTATSELDETQDASMQTDTQEPTPTDDKALPEFLEITESLDSFACGGADDDSITITARVSHPNRVYYISTFFKLTHKTTKEVTEYQIDNMKFKAGSSDTWEITLKATDIDNPEGWVNTYFTYQLVLETKDDGQMVRSAYSEDTDFKPCP